MILVDTKYEFGLVGNELVVIERIASVMARRPRCIGPEELVLSAAALMRELRVDQLPVVDGDGRAVGLLDVQDLLAIRVV
jgi:CBS domain-containing protein